MPEYNLTEHYFNIFTERFDALCDADTEEKERMKAIAGSLEEEQLIGYIAEHIDGYERCSAQLKSAILNSIDFDHLQKGLHEWLVDVRMNEEEEVIAPLPPPSAHLVSSRLG